MLSLCSQSETEQEGCSCLWWTACGEEWWIEQGSIAVCVWLGILRWSTRQSLQHSGSIQKSAAGGRAQKRRRASSSGSSPASRTKEEKCRKKEKTVDVYWKKCSCYHSWIAFESGKERTHAKMRKSVYYFQVFLATITHSISLPVASEKIDLVLFLAKCLVFCFSQSYLLLLKFFCFNGITFAIKFIFHSESSPKITLLSFLSIKTEPVKNESELKQWM